MRSWHITVAFLATVLSMQAATAQTTALPPLESLLPRIVERAKMESQNDRTFDARYSYVRTRVTEVRDGDGELKKREAKTKTNNPEAVLRRRALRAARANADTEKKKDKTRFQLSEDLLRRFVLKILRREWIDGRPALVISLKPKNDDLPEKTIHDRFINKAAGRVWIDEADYALVKADLHLLESVSIVGGLAATVNRFHLQLERERTDDGLWFTRDFEWHAQGHQAFMPRLMDYHEEREDVRKQL